jgi:hypothetical protein
MDDRPDRWLTEKLLNSLAQINDLQVVARTSAFSFKDKDTDIGTIAHKLKSRRCSREACDDPPTPCASPRNSSTR